MPVHQTEVPLTAAGRTATFTLVEFPEDRHFIDIAMKKGKWFVFNERAFFFMQPPGWWDQRKGRKHVSSILRRAERTSLMVTANRKVFKDRLRVRTAWRMEFPAERSSRRIEEQLQHHADSRRCCSVPAGAKLQREGTLKRAVPRR